MSRGLIGATIYFASASAQGNFPDDFKLTDALGFYRIESAGLLKRSLLVAGFGLEETDEINDTYLDFASRALAAEAERIERIRTSFETEKSNGERVCNDSSEEGECAQSTDEDTEKKLSKSDLLSSDFGHFLTPELAPGQAELLHWEDDSTLVQDYAARVGIPDTLVPTLKSYAEEMGLLDIMTNMLYDDPLQPGGSRFFSFSSPYHKTIEGGQAKNFTWNVERPAKKWKSDMHWFNTADELAHEDSLRALARGGFDKVLDGIGKKFGLNHIHVDSLGFVAVTNCDRGYVHTDFEDVEGKLFNFLVGIASPEGAGPELIVESDDQKGEVYYEKNTGVLVGDRTRHGTRECDHRASRGVRITCSIYLGDLTEYNLPVIAGDTTSIFPPTGDENWIWAQRGRHWHKDGGRSLENDLGRRPFSRGDEVSDCDEKISGNECLDDTPERKKCLKTCGVFIDDEEYKPGEERRKVMGY